MLMTNFNKCGWSRCWIQRVFVLDVKDIRNPIIVDSLNLDLPNFDKYGIAGYGRRLSFQDSLLYIANLNHGVIIARGYGVGETTVESRQGHRVNESLQVSPNPFNPAAVVSFQMEKSGMARVEVFSLNGRKILDLDNNFIGWPLQYPVKLEGPPKRNVSFPCYSKQQSS